MPRRTIRSNERSLRQPSTRTQPGRSSGVVRSQDGVPPEPVQAGEQPGHWYTRLPLWLTTALTASLLGALLLALPLLFPLQGTGGLPSRARRTSATAPAPTGWQVYLPAVEGKRSPTATTATPSATRQPSATATKVSTPTPEEEATLEPTASDPEITATDEEETPAPENDEPTAEPEPTEEPTLTPTEEPTLIPTATPLPNPHEARLLQVIDSAIIEVEFGGQTWRVRYQGITVPSPNSSDARLAEIGRRALELNRQLLQAQPLMLEQDVSDSDDEGNLLRYAWAGGVHIGLELVRQGLASVRLSAVDALYQDELYSAQLAAQRECLGLWACN